MTVVLLWHHDDVGNLKHFPHNRPFVRGIHRSPVDSPHKGQWCGALMFYLICAWTNDGANSPQWYEMPLCSLWLHCTFYTWTQDQMTVVNLNFFPKSQILEFQEKCNTKHTFQQYVYKIWSRFFTHKRSHRVDVILHTDGQIDRQTDRWIWWNLISFSPTPNLNEERMWLE